MHVCVCARARVCSREYAPARYALWSMHALHASVLVRARALVIVSVRVLVWAVRAVRACCACVFARVLVCVRACVRVCVLPP
jgi:hypothetical protein